MRDRNSISKETLSKENKEACYVKMLRIGPTKEARVSFQREPYYLTAAKREKEVILNAYSERSERISDKNKRK